MHSNLNFLTKSNKFPLPIVLSFIYIINVWWKKCGSIMCLIFMKMIIHNNHLIFLNFFLSFSMKVFPFILIGRDWWWRYKKFCNFTKCYLFYTYHFYFLSNACAGIVSSLVENAFFLSLLHLLIPFAHYQASLSLY